MANEPKDPVAINLQRRIDLITQMQEKQDSWPQKRKTAVDNTKAAMQAQLADL